MKLAHKLTHNRPLYGIYMLRVGFDTFHAKRDTREVLYTSPEDILVVDRWQIEQDQNEGWDVPFSRNFTKCEVENPFELSCKYEEDWRDSEDFCSKHYSDHNFYAVCRNILSPLATDESTSRPTDVGLLKDIPEHIDRLYDLRQVVDKCANTPLGHDREEIFIQLLKSLEVILGKVEEV